MGLLENVENFAREIVGHFFETHIKSGKAFRPEMCYKSFKSFRSPLLIEHIKTLHLSAQEKEYLRNFIIEFNIDTIRLRQGDTKVNLEKYAKSVGYSSYMELIKSVRNVNASFENICLKILADTRQAYESLFRQCLKKDQATFPEFLHRIKESTSLERSIKTKALLKKANIFSKLSKAETYFTKSKMSFLSPVSIPDTIKCVFPRNSPSIIDNMGALHEAGHALGFVNTSRKISNVLKRLGSPALTETYAFLFQHLVTIIKSTRYQRAALRLYNLFEVRRNCICNILQEKYYAGKAKSKEIVRTIEDSLKIQIEHNEALALIDDNFTSIDLIRANIAACQLREYLCSEYTSNWFKREEPWDIIKSFMKNGNSLTVTELSARIGYAPDDCEPLVRYMSKT